MSDQAKHETKTWRYPRRNIYRRAKETCKCGWWIEASSVDIVSRLGRGHVELMRKEEEKC